MINWTTIGFSSPESIIVPKHGVQVTQLLSFIVVVHCSFMISLFFLWSSWIVFVCCFVSLDCSFFLACSLLSATDLCFVCLFFDWIWFHVVGFGFEPFLIFFIPFVSQSVWWMFVSLVFSWQSSCLQSEREFLPFFPNALCMTLVSWNWSFGLTWLDLTWLELNWIELDR